MTGAHELVTLQRLGPNRWRGWCECLHPVVEADPIAVHRAHQDHVVAEHLAELEGFERVPA